jgi:hypothetical protein
MSRDDDDKWLDALAGRTAENDPAPGAREGRELRASLRRMTAESAPQRSTRDRAREALLLERAQHAGLIPRRARSRFFGLPTTLTPWSLAAALCLAIGLAFFMQPATTPIVERSDDGIVRIQSADPIALKRMLLDELRAAGIEATGYERLGVQGIDADLPQPLPENVRAILNRHGIEAPRDGTLQIEIAPP